MEKLAKIIEVGNLNTRTYTDRNGQSQTITSRQVMMKCGEDTLYAEATGDRAVQITSEMNGTACWVRLGLTARKGQRADGTEFTMTNINIYSIEKF
ncbi:MAG: hypothetical protein K6G08_07720 [Prevotella sp.]|nr:hypothetical protein [Prevotella sp.]